MTQPEPDLAGVARAWLLEHTDQVGWAHEREHGHVHTGIRTWLINGNYHQFWSWWHVGVISLADIPGVSPAQKKYPEAEYEFAIYPITGTPDIEAIRRGDLTHRGFENLLTPPDVLFHFDGVTDEQAVEICDVAVRAIVAGQSCDSDFRGWWEDSLKSTVEHFTHGHDDLSDAP